MKRMSIFGIILISASLFIAGCSTSKTVGTESQGTANGNQTQSGNSGVPGENKRGQFQNPDVYGEVTAINGNEFDLKIIQNQPREMNGPGNRNMGQGNRNYENNPNGQNPNNPRNNSEENRQRSDNTQNTPGDKLMPGNRPNITRTYTGATEKLTLNEGLEITSFQRQGRRDKNNKEQNTTNAAINSVAEASPNANMKAKTPQDLKIGDVLSVWYSDKEKKLISRVMVAPSFKQ